MNWKKYINIALKVILLLLLMHAVIFHELAQYQDKGMKYRYIAYPIGAFSVNIYYKFIQKKKAKYPYTQDLLITSIITLDMLGNTLGFYGSIEWWDDIMHFINSGLLTLFLYSIINERVSNKFILFLALIGVLSWLQIAWEIIEYLTFITSNGHEIASAYRDTIGDLAIGQFGCMLMALILSLRGAL